MGLPAAFQRGPSTALSPRSDTGLWVLGPTRPRKLPGTANRRNTKEITIKRAGGFSYVYFLERDGDRKTTFNCVCSLEPQAFWRRVAVSWPTPRPETPRLEPSNLSTSLGVLPQSGPSLTELVRVIGTPNPFPHSILGVTGDLRDRKLFGPQSYFRYFL